MPSTYTKPNPRTHKHRDYDRQILSDADYAALQGYQSDYQNATTDAQRQQAHQRQGGQRQKQPQLGRGAARCGGKICVKTLI